MNRIFWILVAVLTLALSTPVYGAPFNWPAMQFPAGASLPSTCTAGQVFALVSGGSATMEYCSTANTWSTSWGGGGGGGNLSGTLTPGVYPIATAAHTLGDGTIDYGVTAASTLTVTAPFMAFSAAGAMTFTSQGQTFNSTGSVTTFESSAGFNFETSSTAGVANYSAEPFVFAGPVAGGGVGKMAFQDESNHLMTWVAPASITPYGVTVPAAQGTGALTNDGSGVLSWTAASAGNYVNLCSAVTLSNATCSGGVISFSAVSSFTVSAIPGTYLNLEATFEGYVASGGNILVMSFNGDTTSANYQCQYTVYAASSNNSNSCTGGSIGSGMAIGWLGTTSSALSIAEITIPFYANSLTKLAVAKTYEINPIGGVIGGNWTGTSAITSIKFAASGGGNLTGSLALYGTN